MSHQVVADVLFDTLQTLGWMDDADELIFDFIVDNGIEDATEHVREIQIAMDFVIDNGTNNIAGLTNLTAVSHRLPKLLKEAIDRY